MNISNSILNLSPVEAKDFFLKSASYYNMELPKYFDFGPLLLNLDNKIGNKLLCDLVESDRKKRIYPRYCEGVNHMLLINKDALYEWRPLQFIHPILYVLLVNEITQDEHWNFLKKRFQEFSQNKNICNAGIPVASVSSEKDRKVQILEWWSQVEQESIYLSLQFRYLFKSDITNCYPSIYTHSLAWALHDKDTAKKERDNNSLLGNKIDIFLRELQYGQTNGIPQGSVLMDFIAECLLGYVDLLLTQRLPTGPDFVYHILRYRDDYRVFVNDISVGELILKELNAILAETFGMKLNAKKTSFSDNVIVGAIKTEKKELLDFSQSFPSVQKELLTLFNFSLKYPNSGQLKKPLTGVYYKICGKKVPLGGDVKVLIAICVEIAVRNPGSIPIVVAILSLLFQQLASSEKSQTLLLLQSKLANIINNGYIEIWLQRLFYPLSRDISFSEKMCRIVSGEDISCWNSDWLGERWQSWMSLESFINKTILTNIPCIIDPMEFSLFYKDHSQ